MGHDEFEAWHRINHPEPVADCLACKLDTIQVDAALHGARTTRPVKPRTPDNPWERGRAGEYRKDGSFMPILKEDFSPMGVKEAGERRRELDENKRQFVHAAADQGANA